MTQIESEDDIVKRLCTMEAPLNERLQMFSAYVREHDPDFADAYDDLARRLAVARAGSAAPNIGDVMPAISIAGCRQKAAFVG